MSQTEQSTPQEILPQLRWRLLEDASMYEPLLLLCEAEPDSLFAGRRVFHAEKISIPTETKWAVSTGVGYWAILNEGWKPIGWVLLADIALLIPFLNSVPT